MKPKFTPGPWFARKTGGLKLDQFVCTSDHDCIANMDSGGGGFTIDEVDANTHLIAAAPEMYEALVTALEFFEAKRSPDIYQDPGTMQSFLSESARQKAEEAIKKARGEK